MECLECESAAGAHGFGDGGIGGWIGFEPSAIEQGAEMLSEAGYAAGLEAAGGAVVIIRDFVACSEILPNEYHVFW